MTSKFSAEGLKEILMSLENTHDSITKASSYFLNLEEDYIHEASSVFFDSFKAVIQSTLLKSKVPYNHKHRS